MKANGETMNSGCDPERRERPCEYPIVRVPSRRASCACLSNRVVLGVGYLHGRLQLPYHTTGGNNPIVWRAFEMAGEKYHGSEFYPRSSEMNRPKSLEMSIAAL